MPAFETDISELTRIPYAVGDNLLTRQNNYLAECGYASTVADYDKLPARAVRGDHTRAIGAVSNGWTLVQKFNANAVDLAVTQTKRASLWHRARGGWNYWYLFRFNAAAPMGAGTANGILAFKEVGGVVKACGWDKFEPPASPTDFHDLSYAGQVPVFPNAGGQMDDCSNCHVHAYVAPRVKTFDVAMDPAFLWMRNIWKPAGARFGAAEKGVDWIVGPKEGTPPTCSKGLGSAEPAATRTAPVSCPPTANVVTTINGSNRAIRTCSATRSSRPRSTRTAA